VVARVVEEFPGRTRHAAPEPVNEGSTCRPFWDAEMVSLLVALGSSV
jgi:hypothetical protein